MNKCGNHRNLKSNRIGIGKLVTWFISISVVLALTSCDAIGSRIAEVMFFESYGYDTYSFIEGGDYSGEIVYNTIDEDELYQNYQVENQNLESQNHQEEGHIYQPESQSYWAEEQTFQTYQGERTDMQNDKAQMMKNLQEHHARFLDLTLAPELYDDNNDEGSNDDDFIP